MPRILPVVLLGMSLVPWLAHAAPVTFNFRGTVTQVPIDDFATGIQPGDAITGNFTFDSTAVDLIAAPTSGSYTSTGPAFGLTVAIGPTALPFPLFGSLNIGILNAFVDQYTATASSPALTLQLFFQDNSGTIFSSDSLPLNPPPLAGFAQREFHLDQTDAGGDETQVDGTITSLTCGSGCIASTAPEPSSALPLFGAAVVGAWRILKSKNSRNI